MRRTSHAAAAWQGPRVNLPACVAVISLTDFTFIMTYAFDPSPFREPHLECHKTVTNYLIVLWSWAYSGEARVLRYGANRLHRPDPVSETTLMT